MLLIDLQMPEACDVCPLNYDFCWCKGFKEGEFDKYSDDWNDQVCEGEHRPEYCPLKEIVWCKDCKKLGYTNSHWFCKWLNRCVDEDWFCADGEAKE